MRQTCILFLMCLQSILLMAQPEGNIRGDVADDASGQCLPHEAVDSNPLVGKITDSADNLLSAVTYYDATNPRLENTLVEMRTNYPSLYLQYTSGRRMQTIGWILIGFGVNPTVLGTFLLYLGFGSSGGKALGQLGAVAFGIGSVFIGAGIPLLLNGGKKKGCALDEFLRQYHSSGTSSSHFQLNLYSNKVGIAYVF